MDDPLRLAIVAASPLVRAGLDDELRAHGGVEVVAAVDRWAALARHAVRDAVVADAPPDHPSGGRPPGPAVLLLPRDAEVRALIGRGFTALPDDASIDAIVAAARAAAAGLVATTPDWLRDAPADALDHEPLTPREREVLRHLAAGERNREISAALSISEHTAKYHVAQIIAKLRASSRGQAVAKARRAGLVDTTR